MFVVVATTVVGFNTVWLTVTGFVSTLVLVSSWITVLASGWVTVLVSWWVTMSFRVTTVGMSRVEMTVRGAADTVTTLLLVTGTVTTLLLVTATVTTLLVVTGTVTVRVLAMEVVRVTRRTTGTSLRTRCPFSRTVETRVTLTGLTTVTDLTLPLIVWVLSTTSAACAEERLKAAR